MTHQLPDQWCGIPPDLVRGPRTDVLPLAGEVNWGMDLLGSAHLRGITDGSECAACILDTGVDNTHPILSRVVTVRDFTGSPSGPRDRNGHGTHCTGTVGGSDPRIGVAPGCRLMHGKVLSDGGSGAGTWIAAGIRWAAAEGAEVISMSLGSSSEDSTITRAMEEVSRAGVWCVCAAGNSGPNTPDIDWPGRSIWCVSCAAIDAALKPASFTSAGAKLDTSGPGVGIWSAKPGGGYQSMSGTSMATPWVAGVLTLWRAALKAKKMAIPQIAGVRTLLLSRSTDTHTPGVDRRTGPGWISPLLLRLALVADPPPVDDATV